MVAANILWLKAHHRTDREDLARIVTQLCRNYSFVPSVVHRALVQTGTITSLHHPHDQHDQEKCGDAEQDQSVHGWIPLGTMTGGMLGAATTGDQTLEYAA